MAVNSITGKRKPFPPRILEKMSDEFIEKLKAQFCTNCPISLACWSRHLPAEYYWCNGCQGWWLPDQDTIVCCDGYTLNDPVILEVAIPNRRGKSLNAARLRMFREQHGIRDCPNCRNYTEKFRLIQGYVIDNTQ
ncbi:MAG: hypothetical protein ACYTEQ_15635 [Planctomycetota bacterium]|jgi:hypothetical protein